MFNVDLLIGAGADVNKQNIFSESALMFSAHLGHNKCVDLLIQAGADVNKHGDYGHQTALIQAAGNGHDKCVNLLIKGLHTSDMCS